MFLLKKCLFVIAMYIVPLSLLANEVEISTKNSSFVLSAPIDQQLRFEYYGAKLVAADKNFIAQNGLSLDYYPAFGVYNNASHAIQVTHADGNMSLELVVKGVETYREGDCLITKITTKDKVYPFWVTHYFKTYYENDLIETWTEIKHAEKQDVVLFKAFSANFYITGSNQHILRLAGEFINEAGLYEFPLQYGIYSISNKEGIRNTHSDNPSFMISFDGPLHENKGNVIGASLAYTGNYKLMFDKRKNITYRKVVKEQVNIVAGYNEEASHYFLSPNENFVTPKLLLTFSDKGKGQVSRNFHKWALKDGGMYGANNVSDILLNSWEGVYFDVNQDNMSEMMKGFSEIGGELFVMDDGWFGSKYPRNDGSTSLGDWMVAQGKLPHGIKGLLDAANKNKVKFGIWIEPEMVNTKSELYEKNPSWIIQLPNRETIKGRGETQVTLDLSNPKVQDHVFKVVDDLLGNFPNIEYIKWDVNHYLTNYGSNYLPKNKQSHLYLAYHRGLESVLKRIRDKYPNVVMQSCASGGGRVNYGYLKYFDEFWTSDNTDAFHRIYIQWGTSQFYPAKGMASHVSAEKNHQTGRVIPLKFRFDVAMSGKLGMEMKPSDFTESDKLVAKKSIETYKKIRPLVQFGDLYRLVSPYVNNGNAALMYVNDEKTEAVFFAYNPRLSKGGHLERVVLNGLDSNKTYQITELNETDYLPKQRENPRFVNTVLSGEFLMKYGVDVNFINNFEYGSIIVHIKEK